MKLFSHRHIAAKLLMVNVLILLIFCGVVGIVFFSFSKIETFMTGIVKQDVADIVENARTGRELSNIFADTSLLISVFLQHEDALKTDGESLLKSATALVTAKGWDRQSEKISQEFIRGLQLLLEQGAVIQSLLKELKLKGFPKFYFYPVICFKIRDRNTFII